MAATYAGSAIVCSGTTSVAGPVDITAIQNSATTSFTLAIGGTTVLTGGAGAGIINYLDLRSAKGFTVTVVGGGTVTLFCAVNSRR